jgi:DNA-binding MarR family transcriptional regulator
LLASLAPEEGAAWGGFLRAHARLTAVLDAELRVAHDTPLAWFDALFQLALAPEGRRRLTELAARVLLSPSGISRLVDRLEAEALVAREPDPDDRRATSVVLTRDGWARLHAVHATHVAGIRRHFLTHLSAADLRRLGTLWRRLVVMSEGDAPAAAALPPEAAPPAGGRPPKDMRAAPASPSSRARGRRGG